MGTTFGVTMAASNTLTVDGILKSGGNAATITGGTGIQASSGSEMVIRTNASNDTLTISTAILANGASSFTKSGAGTAVLLSSNTYTGGTTVAGGTLQVGSSTNATASGSNTGLGAAGSTVTVNASTLRFQMGSNSSNAFDENFVFNTGSTLNYNDGKLTFGSATVGTASNNRTITVNGSTTWNPLWTQKQFVMAGVVQGSGLGFSAAAESYRAEATRLTRTSLQVRPLRRPNDQLLDRSHDLRLPYDANGFAWLTEASGSRGGTCLIRTAGCSL